MLCNKKEIPVLHEANLTKYNTCFVQPLHHFGRKIVDGGPSCFYGLLNVPAVLNAAFRNNYNYSEIYLVVITMQRCILF